MSEHGVKAKKKIIVIVGTNASGKTTLGVWLGYRFDGEIISADSRQVYKGMDIGTGKDLEDYTIDTGRGTFVHIPAHMIDVVGPKAEFNLAKFQEHSYKAIEDIIDRGKLPIIVGGSGLYAQAIVDGYRLEGVPPDRRLRKRLGKKNADELLTILKEEDPLKAKNLNLSDRRNKHRLIRAIEIARQPGSGSSGKERKGRVITAVSRQLSMFAGLSRRFAQSPTDEDEDAAEAEKDPDYDYLILALTWPKETLFNRIEKRLKQRLEEEDMIGEVKQLRKRGISWKRLEEFGLEYKHIALYLQDKLSYDEMFKGLNRAIRRFAKRQLTWIRRWERQGARINWIQSKKEAEKLVKDFLQ